jgi:glutathione S-transferase
VKLYYSPGACSLSVRIVLEEIGCAYEPMLASIADGGTQAEAFLEVNEKGRVPVLVVDDEVLTEAPAILLYLAAAFPQSNLQPSSAMETARCLEWFNWLSGSVHAVAFGQLWRPQRFVDDAAVHGLVTTKGRANASEAFGMIERRMPEAGWLVGPRYLPIDAYVLVFYRWGNRIGLDMRGSYPRWTRLTERTLARPAVQRALSQERISVWQ